MTIGRNSQAGSEQRRHRERSEAIQGRWAAVAPSDRPAALRCEQKTERFFPQEASGGMGCFVASLLAMTGLGVTGGCNCQGGCPRGAGQGARWEGASRRPGARDAHPPVERRDRRLRARLGRYGRCRSRAASSDLFPSLSKDARGDTHVSAHGILRRCRDEDGGMLADRQAGSAVTRDPPIAGALGAVRGQRPRLQPGVDDRGEPVQVLLLDVRQPGAFVASDSRPIESTLVLISSFRNKLSAEHSAYPAPSASHPSPASLNRRVPRIRRWRSSRSRRRRRSETSLIRNMILLRSILRNI
ncbi:hypothetical protein DFR50_12438 [Roseiarcus fermentans]|uniref:Uncharacterized protein n=1 Tax=Roseiarcus fermentans TaxID=1473586 RepID=A0A366F1V5_9HYPH|nr:hypothetical protein DFR50_12438 [Roseiarcus fermentans]